MPLIFIYTGAGKSIDQKRGVVKDITEALCKNFGVQPTAVKIRILDIPKENAGNGGKLGIDS